MPPKKEGKNSGPSTAASKKKQNEDVLRKLAEEEEMRKKAEEEERDRKRREADQLAKNKEISKHEKKMRRNQMGELDAIIDYNRSCAERVDTDGRQLYKWQRYLRCDGTPDPTIAAEINTYINLLLEEPRSSVQEAMDKCKILLSLVDELKFIIADTPPDQMPPATLEQHKSTLARLQCLIQYKLDQATYDELIHASENVNPETSNLERILRTENLVSLCIWGNLIKNPRIRSHEFPDVGFTFEIPKPIGNSSVAVRVMQTEFDHFSEMTKTYCPKKKVVAVADEKPVVIEEKPVAVSQPKEEVHEEERKGSALSKPDETDPEFDILAQLSFLDTKLPQKPKVEEKKVEEEEEPEYDAAPTPPPEDYDDYEELIDVVDLRQNQPVGGIFHINLLQLPPQPKVVKNWTLRLLQTPAQLHFVDYVATTSQYYPVAVSLAGPMAQTLNFALGFTSMQTLEDDYVRKSMNLLPLMGLPERKPIERAAPRRRAMSESQDDSEYRTVIVASIKEKSETIAEEPPTSENPETNVSEPVGGETADDNAAVDETATNETADETMSSRPKESFLGDLLEAPMAAGGEITLTARAEDEASVVYQQHARQNVKVGKKASKKGAKSSSVVAPGAETQDRRKSIVTKKTKKKSKASSKTKVAVEVAVESGSGAGATLNEGGHEKGADSEAKDKEVRPPVPVVLRLPTNVMFFEAPQVARWHDDRKCWVSDAVTNLQYKEDQRLISFRLERFGIFTLIQDRHINMPFQSWEMRPLGTNRIRVHIVAAIAEVEIEICEDKCALVKPDDKSELKHLIDQFMPLDKFITAMQNAGINLFPEPDSYKFVGITNKNHFLEKRVYQHMSLVSSGMAFAWSKWNADCNDSQRVLVQAVSWSNAESPTEDDWRLIQVERRRAVELAMTEFADAFNDERAPDSPYNSTIFHLAKHMCGGSDSLKWGRIVDSSYQFLMTVEKFLNATRLLVFS